MNGGLMIAKKIEILGPKTGKRGLLRNLSHVLRC